jgi:hypothetical protein
MFSKDVNIFNVRRPATACQPISELHSIANSFAEVLTYINEANSTDDCIEQIKYLAGGFVDLKVRQHSVVAPELDRGAASQAAAGGDPLGDH